MGKSSTYEVFGVWHRVYCVVTCETFSVCTFFSTCAIKLKLCYADTY